MSLKKSFSYLAILHRVHEAFRTVAGEWEILILWDFFMGSEGGNFLRNLGGGCLAGGMGRIASW